MATVTPTPVEPAAGKRPLGAAFVEGVAHFRVWAPQASCVELILESPVPRRLALKRIEGGYFVAAEPGLLPGALYKYEVDGKGPWPDPCSRFQPQGPHGPSQLTSPQFDWQCHDWPGIDLKGQVIYELHIGTFTPEGTFEAAIGKLEHLVRLGISLIELLPIGECPGDFNWGYDGVQLWAPSHSYGTPESLRRFVDRAHAHGIAVILDVVYNHVGPDGNYLSCFSPYYFSRNNATEWGDALNFDAQHAHGMRDFVIQNACYWVREFRFDGFRLDATQSIFDTSPHHIVAELIEKARAAAAPRNIVVIAENEPQRSEHMLSPRLGGYGLDAMWNDDFHHSARVALTGSRDGYFHDYSGRAQELLSAVRRGFLYQGQYYPWQKQVRGSPLRRQSAWRCVHFLQNHDQVGNTFTGVRLHTFSDPGRYRALTALLLLGPQIPLLFMGQEFLSSSAFVFFADHKPPLRTLVHQGRREFLAQFKAYASADAQARIPDPAAEAAFLSSKLDWTEATTNASALALHTDLLRLRREDPVIREQCDERLDGATLSERAFVLRWFDDEHGDRMLVVNLDAELVGNSFAEPLLAPPLNASWQLHWSSDAVCYGGTGAVAPIDGNHRWRITPNSAVLLRARPNRTERDGAQQSVPESSHD